MAPAPKSRGGGGASGSGSSSSSSCGLPDYPCSTEISYIYGQRSFSVFSNNDLYGQLVLFSIWTTVLILLLFRTWKCITRWLQLAVGAFLIGYIFLGVRYGLIIGKQDIPIGYRYESSIVVSMQSLGMIALFASTIQLQDGKPLRIGLALLWLPYAILRVVYIILDFLISSQALNEFKDGWRWTLSDRDFGLTFTKGQIEKLKLSNFHGRYLAPENIFLRGWPLLEDFWSNRNAQIKVGVAANWLAVALVVSILAVSAVGLIKGKSNRAGGIVSEPLN
jgi:hypothetical protein